MDAGDARDDNKDIQLYKSSRELLPELRLKLPSLVRARGHIRYWVLDREAENIAKLLDRFQEWPQLLDQDLPVFISTLVEALLEYLQRGSESYHFSVPIDAALPLPRAVCRLLYSFCKVRGQKVIVRFFHNKARYVDLLLRAFCHWTELDGRSDNGANATITWEEYYIMLLWLSHLMLTPFDLDTISSYSLPNYPNYSLAIQANLPGVSKSLLTAAMTHAFSPGKERDAACALLVRMALRPDMQRYELLKSLLEMVIATITDVSDDASTSVYRKIGAIAILSGVFKSGSESDIAPFLQKVFATLRQTVENQDGKSATQSNAYTRQLLIKAIRIVLVRCLTPTLTKYLSSDLDDTINFSIEYFVSSLNDKDTPVRVEASKSISLCTLKLGPPDDESIVQGMVDMLGGDIRFEDVLAGQPSTTSLPDDALFDLISTSKNLEHADGLQWHGVMLSLARLLLNRSLELHLLPDVVKILISGLDFEQRSSKGAVFGTQVRDAASFGLWSLSRKYTTLELTMQSLSRNPDLNHGSPLNLVKKVASALIICGCFDPQGNMRRGASAALQELIGRHPDVVDQGIPLVQLIDYQGVASRKRAMQKISCGVALLHQSYWADLSRAILTWRGVGAADAVSRRAAAETFCELGEQSDHQQLLSLLEYTLKMLHRLPSHGSTDKRHGLLYALAAVIDAFTKMSYSSGNSRSQGHVDAEVTDQTRISNIISSLYGDIHFGSSILGREPSFGTPRNLLYESISKLVGSLFSSVNKGAVPSPVLSQTPVIDTFVKCIKTNDEETANVILSTSQQVFGALPENDRAVVVSNIAITSTSPRLGSLMALAGAYKGTRLEAKNERIVSFHYQIYLDLRRYIGRDSPVETRCSAWRSLREIVVVNRKALQNENHPKSATAWINEIDVPLSDALDDYTTDHRGDVGSWVRLEGIKFLEALITNHASELVLENISPLIGSLVRMAAERLDKVRLQSWKSLSLSWTTLQLRPAISALFTDERAVSHPQYFTHLLSQFHASHPLPLLKGYVTSFSGGAESLAIATCTALVSFLSSSTPPDTDIFSHAITILSEATRDDRYAVPCLHLIAFLLDQGLVPRSANYVRCFAKVELAHYRSANSARLQAALLCYAGLMIGDSPAAREKACRKVRVLVRHPQTKIRGVAEEVLLLYG
ncbi:MAG: hypothetical protein Q9160_006314 [Pyrenula sp. 1 TL-2023]